MKFLHKIRALFLDDLGQDLSYAGRQLLKSPGFTATVVVTLGLAIGACTVVFTAINTTLLHPIDGAEPDRNILIYETQLPQSPQLNVSPPTFLDLERETQSFEDLAAWAGTTVSLSGDTEPLQLAAALVTPHVFDVWNTQPVLGRGFLPADFTGSQASVVVLSYSLWQRAFGASPAVIGRTLNLNGSPCTVVGVMSPRFARFGSDLDLWMPLLFSDQQRNDQRGARYLRMMGLLKRGVTLSQAQAELDVFAANLARQYPDTNKGEGLLVRQFTSYLNRSMAPMLYVLLGAVGCVLSIACANVANLLLARATVRQKEMSIRAALGAGRGRLIRQLLVESILLAALGGGAGIVLAQWGLRFIRIYGPSAGTDLARLAYVEMDSGMLAFTVGFSLLTGVVFGLVPAWMSSRADLNEALKQGSRGSTEGGARGRLRSLLVVLEVSLALVLLAGAGLLVRSFAQLAQLDPGFAPEHVATMHVALNGRKYAKPETRMRFTDDLLAKLEALPGVDAAALTNLSPFNTPGTLSFNVDGRPPAAPGAEPSAVPYLVTPEYFRTMGVRLSRGRAFAVQDSATAPPVIVINEALAKQYFANEDPLGRRLAILYGKNPGPTGEIVGIVGDVMQGQPGQWSPPQLYLPWAQQSSGGFYAMVRTTGDPARTLPLLKSQVYAVDKDQPVGPVRTLSDLMGDTLARPHLMLTLLGAFGVIALVIAAVGIYGVMAYSVSQRTMEFGIRMALGASRPEILQLVLRNGLKVVSIGLVIGLAAALALGRVVESLLYKTSPRDPVTLAAIVVGLLLISFVACLVPARRATKVDPMVALRAE